MPNPDVMAFTYLEAVPETAAGEHSTGFVKVQAYLERFGYLEAERYDAGALDDATSSGLERFQRFFDLPVSGVFDDATRAAMMRPRCALPDPPGGRLAYSTTCSWNEPDLSYAMVTGTPDVAGTGEFDAVRNAFASWAALSRLTFTEVAPGAAHDVDVAWRPANDPDYSMVAGVLAHADFPPGCGVVTNTKPKPVHFDDSEHVWSVGAAPGAFDIETVALHEIGHIVGLAHSSVAGAVMAPTVSSNATKRALTQDDIDGYLSLYPDAPGGSASLNGAYHVLLA